MDVVEVPVVNTHRLERRRSDGTAVTSSEVLSLPKMKKPNGLTRTECSSLNVIRVLRPFRRGPYIISEVYHF